MMKKLVIGIIISAGFIYLSLKGIELDEVWVSLKGTRYGFLLPAALIVFFVQVLRSIRWGVILSPIEKIDQKTLFPITCIGFMAIILAPMRTGEIVRPYLVSLKRAVPMGSGIATVLIERVMDVLMLLAFLFFVLLQAPLPSWLIKGGNILLAILLFVLTLIVILIIRPRAIVKTLFPITSRLPQRICVRIERFILNFINGFAVISDMKKLFQVFSLSFLIWIFSAFAVYALFSFYNLHLGFTEALTVMVITALGISIPSAPGFLGNFQFACIVALSLWGVSKTDAFTFAMVYYFLGIGIIAFLSLLCLPFIDIPMRQIFSLRNIKGD